jgi:hypothetical protein
VFWRNAQRAAQGGDCETARSLANKVAEIDPAYYRAAKVDDTAIAGCFAAEEKRKQEAAAEAKRQQDAAEARRLQETAGERREQAARDLKRRVDAFVAQCRTVAARNDCEAARKIAAQIAAQYPDAYRDQVVKDATIARCLGTN